MTGILAFAAAPAIALLWRLSRVRDVFKIYEELTGSILGCAFFSGKPGPTTGVTATDCHRNMTLGILFSLLAAMRLWFHPNADIIGPLSLA